MAKDHPDVVAFPPLILAGMLGAAVLLGWLVPLDWLPDALTGLVPGGAVLVLAAGIAGAGIAAFRKAGTNIEPHKPALILVEAGPYRFTRNPMYLGLMLVLLGVGLAASLDWAPLLLPVFWAILHRGVVLREEAYLSARFGAPYEAFLARTRRWL